MNIDDIKYGISRLAAGANLDSIQHLIKAEKLIDDNQFVKAAEELEACVINHVTAWEDRCFDLSLELVELSKIASNKSC